MFKSFKKIEASTKEELITNTEKMFFSNKDYGVDATNVVFRAYGDGVDPVYILQVSTCGKFDYELKPIDNRFETFGVDSINDAIHLFYKEFMFSDEDVFDITFCQGTRGLTQYLTTIDCDSYFLAVILEKISGSDAIMTMFKCAEKLGLQMSIEVESIDGYVKPYMTENKLTIGGENVYTMDLASSIRRAEKVNIVISK
jgi:hypothetical protein